MVAASSGAVVGTALGSAAAFATAGSFGASLLGRGWSPGAAVAARVLLGALLLTVPAVRALRGRWGLLRVGWRSIVGLGVLGVAGAQLAFFSAVQTLSVGVALLLEYSAVLLVMLWLWARHGTRPRRRTWAGTGVALIGLVLVLQVLTGVEVDLVGVGWGLLAAVGLAGYFLVSAGAGDRAGDTVPPLVLAWAGMLLGGVVLGVAGVVGVLPLHAGTADVTLAGTRVSWVVPVAGLGLVAGAVAYGAGVHAARRLGATAASFVGLTEVLFAVGFAFLLLGQEMTRVQLVGGALVVTGIVLVQTDARPAPAPIPPA